MQQSKILLSEIIILISFLFISSSVLIVLMEPGAAQEPRAIYVKESYPYSNGDGTANRPYQSIQKAIDLAHDGDAIYVFEGTYNETLVINKRINLSGLDRKNTTIQKRGANHQNLIEITADNVAIEDINISGTGGVIETSLVHVNNANYVRIMGIQATHVKKWGIYLDGSNDGIVGYSTFDNITNDGIHGESSNNNVFSSNRFNEIGSTALYLRNGNNNIIFNNTFRNTTLWVGAGTAIGLYYCSNVNISNNTIKICSLDGIHMNGGSNNLIRKNRIKNCDSEGIFIDSLESSLLANTLENNQIGINLEGSSCTVMSNTVRNSTLVGLIADKGTSNNVITLNYFISNLVNAQEQGSNQWDYQDKGNYWDDYHEGDRDKNGIGDQPYTRMGGIDHYPIGKFLKPPMKPTSPSPPDSKDDVGLSITLKVNVTDPDSSTLSVYFYNALNDELLGYQGGVARNTIASCSFTLPFETTCSWYTIVSDGMLENRSDIWFFTTRQIPPTNKKPIADPGGPYAVKIGQIVDFNGSRSVDPDGQIIFYRWNFGDGSSEILDKLPKHSYSDPGSYTVTLTVVDNDGRSAIANTTVTVSGEIYVNTPPIASFSALSTTKVNTLVTYNASASYDTDGTIVWYRWDFNGDGVNDTGWLSSPIVTHVFSSAGSYLVTLEVKDNGNMISTYPSLITVQANQKKSPGFEIILIFFALTGALLIYRKYR